MAWRAWRGVAWRVVALTKRRFGDRRRLRNRGRDRSGRGGGRSGARRSWALFAPQGHEHAGLNTQASASPSCGGKPFSACRHGVGSPLLQRASLPQRRSLLQRGSADAAPISLSCAHLARKEARRVAMQHFEPADAPTRMVPQRLRCLSRTAGAVDTPSPRAGRGADGHSLRHRYWPP